MVESDLGTTGTVILIGVSQRHEPRRLRMAHRLYEYDDFEATIRIYSTAEGGRRTPAFNGIRWDFTYADNSQPTVTLYMIWPDFFADGGQALPTDQPLPVGDELSARMLVLMDEMRAEVHRDKIAPGVRFFCHEGEKRVAEGVVTKITGLFTPRDEQRQA